MRAERDYIDRTIATVRNHREADNCWPQWANIFADEIERLRAELQAAQEREKVLREALAEACFEWEAWMNKGMDVAEPQPDDLDIYQRIKALVAQRTEEARDG